MKHIAILLVLGVMTLKADGQVLAAEYRFDPPSTGTTVPYYWNNLVLSSASNFSAGSGLSGPVGFTQGASLTNSNDKAYWGSSWTASGTIDPNDYFGFIVTPQPGYLLRLDSVTFWERRSSTGPTLWQMRPGPAFSSAIGFGPTMAGNTSPQTPFAKRKVSPAGINFSIPLELRLYATNSGNISGTWRIDTVRVFIHVITPVPIELISFTGDAVHEGVALHWSTATETDNDHFTLYRSLNGQDGWDSIATVSGAGTSQVRHDYELLDDNAVNGVNYYKLRQTDTDGTSEEFYVIAVLFRHVQSLVFTTDLVSIPGKKTLLLNAAGQIESDWSEIHTMQRTEIFFLKTEDEEIYRCIRAP